MRRSAPKRDEAMRGRTWPYTQVSCPGDPGPEIGPSEARAACLSTAGPVHGAKLPTRQAKVTRNDSLVFDGSRSSLVLLSV